ncbi:hypothetical protein QJS10_CPB21g00985 [Acorus calamus]|uniref:Uncharacterized protein n=1 Tax=Acorus calamus TaxID=4465 RepID=A0AAV9C4R3_ACOCL|nr:hypothetical protein QJS10_CPB21g00985 [Acorus calamus]
MGRLDRLMANGAWLLTHLEALVLYHPYGLSDHSAMQLVSSPPFPSGPKPFKFFNAWTLEESFLPAVREAWAMNINGSAMFRLANKLKTLKVVLKKWSRGVVGPMQDNIQQLRRSLEAAQESLQRDPLNSTLISRETRERILYKSLLSREVSMIRHKSRQN